MTLTRKQPLKRTKPLFGSGSLNRVSKEQAKTTRQKRKVYDKTRADECFSCKRECRGLTPSHILSQKQHSDLRSHPLNIVWECWPTHQLWEHDKTEYARQFPDAFADKMRLMQALRPNAYAFFRMKHPHLFDAR